MIVREGKKSEALLQLLSELKTYLSLADMGIIPTAGNKMTIALGNNNTKEANRVFQSAFLFIIITCISIFIILIPIILLPSSLRINSI